MSLESRRLWLDDSRQGSLGLSFLPAMMLAAASTGKLLAKTQATTVQRLGFVDRMATSLVTKQAELASELDQIWWCEISIDDHIFPGFVLWFATGPILGPGSYHRPICVRICSLLTWARPGIFAINLWNQSQRHILSSWVFHSLNWITIVIIRISYQLSDYQWIIWLHWARPGKNLQADLSDKWTYGIWHMAWSQSHMGD